jgi:hypothetical protein
VLSCKAAPAAEFEQPVSAAIMEDDESPPLDFPSLGKAHSSPVVPTSTQKRFAVRVGRNRSSEADLSQLPAAKATPISVVDLGPEFSEEEPASAASESHDGAPTDGDMLFTAGKKGTILQLPSGMTREEVANRNHYCLTQMREIMSWLQSATGVLALDCSDHLLITILISIGKAGGRLNIHSIRLYGGSRSLEQSVWKSLYAVGYPLFAPKAWGEEFIARLSA